MDANFASMKRIKPSFYIGMGDHFTSLRNLASFDAAIRKAFGATEVFYRRFYLTAGDNEAGAYAGRQNALGAERPFFYHARLFIVTAHHHTAGIGSEQSGYHVQQRGFPRTARTDQDVHLPLRQSEVSPRHDTLTVVVICQVFAC